MSKVNTAFLRIPLYLAAHVEKIDTFAGLTPAQLEQLPRSYTPDELRQIVEALKHAAANPLLDLRPLAPRPGPSNAQLHGFLRKVLASLEKAGGVKTEAHRGR